MYIPMTIRQVLVRRYQLVMLGLVVGIALGRIWHATRQTHNLRLGIGLTWMLSLFVLFYFGFRCPRCHTMLTTKGLSILTGRPMGCPKCGVSLDDPIDPSAKMKRP